MTTPDRHWKGMTLRDQLREWRERAADAEARVAELEAFHMARLQELGAERALADELAEALTSPKSSGGKALTHYYRSRSGAQGEEGDG